MGMLSTKRTKEEIAIIKHNAMVKNPDKFVARSYNTLRKNAIAKMERDGRDTTDAKLVEQCVALYISACIYELKRRPNHYLIR